MSTNSRLYELLPAYIRFQDQRRRDQELDIAPLEALVQALEVTFEAIEDNIETLYDGWFIETCEEWRIPYLADLLGVRGLEDAAALLPTQRARVANTIAYRRRKGTPEVLGQAAQDNTGWPCYVKVYRNYLGVTQSLRSPRPERGRWVDVRKRHELELLRTPFDRHARTVDLRGGPPRVSANTSGGYHPHRLGLTFWRLGSYPIRQAQARPARQNPGHCYRFHPAAVDTPLFTPSRTRTGKNQDPPQHLPLRITRSALTAELAEERAAPRERLTFSIKVQSSPAAAPTPVPAERLGVADLSKWPDPEPWPYGNAEVVIDPETGRLAFQEGNPNRLVQLDFSFGMAADLGGGPYPRPSACKPADPNCWQAVIDHNRKSDDTPTESAVERFTSLAPAIEAWRTADSPKNALFRIRDSGLHDLGDQTLVLPENSRLTIRADERRWPLVKGQLKVYGEAGSQLRLDGLAWRGDLRLDGEVSLELEHCSLIPPEVGEAAEMDSEQRETLLSGANIGADTKVSVRRSVIYGAIRLPVDLRSLLIADSVVGSGQGVAVSGPGAEFGPPATLERTTLLGAVKLHQLLGAANTLFTAPVEIERSIEGQVRYCYLPHGSKVPARFQTMEGPALTFGDGTDQHGVTTASSAFVSLTYGHPGFAQLSLDCDGIDQAGEQGNEIGAFHSQRLGDRLTNLSAALDGYLPTGFTARIAFAT